MSVSVPVSIGELWDKYTILLIKTEKIIDIRKLALVKKEITSLQGFMDNYAFQENHFYIELKKINEKLWDIEDKLRIKEADKKFDNEFISLARAVYYTNDERANIKNHINIHYNSTICEVKEYVDYK